MVLNYVTWNVNPEFFALGDFSIRWYGVLFASAFFVGYLIINRIFKKENIPAVFLDKLTIYMALGTVLGARLGHCFFYEPEYFMQHPLEILMVWHGGLASHGATIGIILAVWLFSRSVKRPFSWILDRIVIVVASAGFFIRLGNLMNSEIIGNPADVPWAFIFTSVDNIPRHPAQLYEALFCVILFAMLIFMYYRKAGNIPWLMFSVFLTLLWTFRFFIEFLKEPQVAKEAAMSLDIGQILSIPLVVIGILLTIYAVWRHKKQQVPHPASNIKTIAK